MPSVRQEILEQVRRDGDDLAAIKSQLDRVEDKPDGIACLAIYEQTARGTAA